ncbi:lysosome-associated membrane glycoprotein 3 isoform X2 [Eleutherodactylus coqui]|uniref:lysosome-associated membrane glycoprotein 3 isoform X2 n=1 Tax=Eleutherodactylus coqui TaxID=57060 RepID=UPI0034627CCF
MAGPTLIWSLLLVSGTFLVDTSAEISSSIMLNDLSSILVSAQHNATTHAPSNAITHAPSNATTHAPSNVTRHAPSNATTHAPSKATTHAPSNATTHAPFNATTHAPSKATTHTPSNATTHAPSNATTHTPSNATTHTPSNATTHTPSNATTHAPSNATTHAPSNSTTHGPFNTTTHLPVTNTTTHAPFNTTTHATPTLPPTSSPPEIGNYTVKDGKGPCIIAIMGLELQIDNSTKERTDRRYFNIQPKHTNANGTCGDSKSNLLLQFPEGSINFTFIKESKTYYIEEVSAQFYVASAGRWNGNSGKVKLLSSDVGYSVMCKRTPTVQLGENLELILADVKLQAFEIKNGTFSKEEMCSYDRNITAVAIAIAVIVIVVIAIILYFVWQKRRSSGYEHI